VTISAAAALFLTLGLGLLAQTEEPSGQEAPKIVQSVAPVQPIPYSHKKHLAMGLKCDFCHTNPDPGTNMTIPQAAKCMTCHADVAKDSPTIQKLARYDESKKPIPWVRIYSVPAEIYWNHRTHLKAGTKCETCHGQVAEMEMMRLATNVTTMQGCVDCHQQHDAPVGCDSCHENSSSQ